MSEYTQLPDDCTSGNLLSVQEPNQLTGIIAEMMRPIMQTIGEMLKNNTAAVEQIAGALAVQSERLDSIERQVRLQFPVTNAQAVHLSREKLQHARELLAKYKLDGDAKAVKKLAKAIQDSVLARYGCTCLRDIPKCEYDVAMAQIQNWRNALIIMDVVKEARKREELALQSTSDGVGVDGA